MEDDTTLKNKTIYGLFWSFSDIIARQGLQFIVQIILARLLMPKDFGIIGMITVFIAISRTVVDSGFSNALIRDKHVNQEDYSTAFYFNLLISIVFYIILFFASPIISSFFNEPILIKILRVVSFVLVIDSFGSVQRTILCKKLDFKTQTRISLISSFISGLLAIFAAYNKFGVWSLVIKNVSMQLSESLLLFFINGWVPSFVFKLNSFKKLFYFGWKLLISGLISTLYQNLYYLIIGKIFSSTELGYYTNAQRFRDVASQSITTAVQKVSYPVLSKLQNEENSLKDAYKKIIVFSVFITFPLMIGLAATAPALIAVLFGDRWLDSILYFQILCFAGMLFPLHAINLNILQVKGRTDLFLKIELIKKGLGVFSIIIVLILRLGVIGLVWVAVLNSYISYFINSYYSGKFINYSTFKQMKDISKILIISIFIGLLVYYIGTLLQINIGLVLMIQLILGIFLYILICKVFKLNELKEMTRYLKLLYNHIFFKKT